MTCSWKISYIDRGKRQKKRESTINKTIDFYYSWRDKIANNSSNNNNKSTAKWKRKHESNIAQYQEMNFQLIENETTSLFFSFSLANLCLSFPWKMLLVFSCRFFWNIYVFLLVFVLQNERLKGRTTIATTKDFDSSSSSSSECDTDTGNCFFFFYFCFVSFCSVSTWNFQGSHTKVQRNKLWKTLSKNTHKFAETNKVNKMECRCSKIDLIYET